MAAIVMLRYEASFVIVLQTPVEGNLAGAEVQLYRTAEYARETFGHMYALFDTLGAAQSQLVHWFDEFLAPRAVEVSDTLAELRPLLVGADRGLLEVPLGLMAVHEVNNAEVARLLYEKGDPPHYPDGWHLPLPPVTTTRAAVRA